jgi:hypothetical protein
LHITEKHLYLFGERISAIQYTTLEFPYLRDQFIVSNSSLEESRDYFSIVAIFINKYWRLFQRPSNGYYINECSEIYSATE